MLTVSSGVAGGVADDASGDRLARGLAKLGFAVVARKVCTDGFASVKEAIEELLQVHPKVIVTTGGTGFSDDDQVPEATRSLIDREAPGIAEALRAYGRKKTKLADLSRGVAGVAGATLIVNLPGTPKAVDDALDVFEGLLPHAVALLGSEGSRGVHAPQ